MDINRHVTVIYKRIRGRYYDENNFILKKKMIFFFLQISFTGAKLNKNSVNVKRSILNRTYIAINYKYKFIFYNVICL